MNTHAIEPQALVEFFGTLFSREWALECMKDLLLVNLRGNLQIIVQTAKEYAEQLGVELIGFTGMPTYWPKLILRRLPINARRLSPDPLIRTKGIVVLEYGYLPSNSSSSGHIALVTIHIHFIRSLSRT